MTRPAAEPGRLEKPPLVPATRRPHPARRLTPTGGLLTLRTIALFAATLSTGLGAGVFADFSHTIMPGLRSTDDRTFVGAYQAIDLAIYNPWFIGVSFLGALVLGILAILLSIGRPELPWIVAAVVLHVIVIVVTFAVHAPLNAVIETAGDPDAIVDPAAVRAAFDEARWQAWNVLRAALSVVSFALLAWALTVHGRATGS